MQKLVIIDGHAILHRAFHALPPLTNSKGELINAVYGFISMLLRVVEDLHPTHLVVTFDRPKPTFRKKIFKEYQAKRPEMDEGLKPQIETVHRVVKGMGISIFEMDGYEADDVIGTIVNKCKVQSAILRQAQDSTEPSRSTKCKITDKNAKIPEEWVSIVVTGDRDILQLVGKHTKVYMPVKGLSESRMYGEAEVVQKFGIKPSQVVDYKALMGDSSDNYPGVPGIGPKTAGGLLKEFKTLEDIYSHLDQIKSEGIRKKLAENKESALMAKKLATIVCNVPIEIDLKKLTLGNLLKPNIVNLFEELEFRSLIPRLGRGGGSKNHDARIMNQESKRKKDDGQISLF